MSCILSIYKFCSKFVHTWWWIDNHAEKYWSVLHSFGFGWLGLLLLWIGKWHRIFFWGNVVKLSLLHILICIIGIIVNTERFYPLKFNLCEYFHPGNLFRDLVLRLSFTFWSQTRYLIFYEIAGIVELVDAPIVLIEHEIEPDQGEKFVVVIEAGMFGRLWLEISLFMKGLDLIHLYFDLFIH